MRATRAVRTAWTTAATVARRRHPVRRSRAARGPAAAASAASLRDTWRQRPARYTRPRRGTGLLFRYLVAANSTVAGRAERPAARTPGPRC